jgi:hypothetical protein
MTQWLVMSSVRVPGKHISHKCVGRLQKTQRIIQHNRKTLSATLQWEDTALNSSTICNPTYILPNHDIYLIHTYSTNPLNI